MTLTTNVKINLLSLSTSTKMLNQCVLVGRVNKVEGFKIELNVEHGNDIPLHLNEVLFESVKHILEEGTTIAVKAKLQGREGLLVAIAERITYLQSGRK